MLQVLIGEHVALVTKDDNSQPSRLHHVFDAWKNRQERLGCSFVGGALQPEMLNHTDEELIEIVRDELDKTLGVRGEPDFIRVYRYDGAMPQYHVGHLERVALIEDLALKHPRMTLEGIACRGVGIPDAIASGQRAAEAIVS